MVSPSSLFLALALAVPAGVAQEPPPQAGETKPEAEDFDARLKRSSYFKKIVWTTDRSFAPFDILIQKQPVPEVGYEQKVATYWGPWFVRMASVFDEQFATPAQLPPAKDPKPIRLIVLASEGDFLNYSKTAHTIDSMGATEFYDDRIRSVVTCWSSSSPGYARCSAVLKRLVFALMQQRSTAFGGRQPPLWLREGVSSALSWHVAPDAASAFAKPLIDARLLEQLVKLSQDPAQQNLFLWPIAELPSIIALEDLWKSLEKKTETAGLALKNSDPWYAGYASESSLWVHFLRRDGAPAHNKAFANYVQAAMRGGGSPGDLEHAFEGIDLALLDREFFRWCYARYQESGKGKPDEAMLQTLFPVVAASATPASSLSDRLATKSDDAATVHALSCRRAAKGDVDGAITSLKAMVAVQHDAAVIARANTEIMRLEAWKLARDSWLAELVATGGRLQLEQDGKKSTIKPKRVEEGAIFYDSGKLESSLPLASLAPALLAGQMKAAPPAAPPWARAYAFVLCDDDRWDKQLKDKSIEATALRADAAGAYARLKLTGIAAEHLNALAENAELADADAAQAVLERSKRMLGEVGAEPLVVQRLPAVRDLAVKAANRYYDIKKPAVDFSGKTKWLSNDEVEVDYEFDSPAECDDWRASADHLLDWYSQAPPLATLEADRSFAVHDGVWVARGMFARRHFMTFEAPMSVKIILRHGTAASEEETLGGFTFGVCADGDQNFIAFAESGERYLSDAATGRNLRLDSSHDNETIVGQSVELELAHDGKIARYVHAGISEPDFTVAPRHSGEMFFLIHSDRELAIESIRIRATIGDLGKRRLRECWIERKLKETGLPPR